jgi:hypothetical protein
MHWRTLGGWVRALSPSQIFARLERKFAGVALSNGALTTIDSVLCDSYAGASWEVTLAKGTARRVVTVWAGHDGATASDATAATYTEAGADDIGTVDVVLSVDVNGAGAAQVMRLRALASSTGWTATAFRHPNKPAQP